MDDQKPVYTQADADNRSHIPRFHVYLLIKDIFLTEVWWFSFLIGLKLSIIQVQLKVALTLRRSSWENIQYMYSPSGFLLPFLYLSLFFLCPFSIFSICFPSLEKKGHHSWFQLTKIQCFTSEDSFAIIFKAFRNQKNSNHIKFIYITPSCSILHLYRVF